MGILNAVGQVWRGAHESLSDMEELWGALDGGVGCGVGTGMISPTIAGESAWGGDGLNGKG